MNKKSAHEVKTEENRNKEKKTKGKKKGRKRRGGKVEVDVARIRSKEHILEWTCSQS